MAYISRSDLLRVLAHAESAEPTLLADSLGFTRHDLKDQHREQGADGIFAPAQLGQATQPGRMLYTALKEPRYWHVAGCTPVEPETEADGEIVPLKKYQAGTFTRPIPLAERPLLNPGEWQNCWDRNLAGDSTGRAIDLPANIKRLARAQPVEKLQRKRRRNFNHNTVLLMERTPATRPVWDDMCRAWQSLRELLGDEQLDAYYWVTGPAGRWYRQVDNRQAGEEAIPENASIILLGTFGALDDGELSEEWLRLIERLQCSARQLRLLVLCPIKRPPAKVQGLELATIQPQDEPLNTLLAALALAWMPSVVQLRHLRKAIPGATITHELRAYNHHSVERNGQWLSLKQDAILQQLRLFESRESSNKANVEKAVDAWQQSLSATARDIERLQRNLHPAIPSPEGYPHLLGLAALAEEEFASQEEGGVAYSLILSMLPLTYLLADLSRDRRWQAFLKVVQRVARDAQQRLPLKQQYMEKSEPVQWLIQRSNRLVLTRAQQGNNLLALGTQPYYVQARRQLTATTPFGDERVDIVDQQYQWRLEALGKPTWAERIKFDSGRLHTRHAGGAEFLLQPASPDHPAARWHCRHNPWPWASSTGIDEHGLWADLHVKGIEYRLRWIAPGTFLMGSPQDEPGRNDNEILHPVTLTQGYWLGETSCTQALWQAVMGENPASSKSSGLPVNTVSWNNCQRFIKRLQKLVPQLPLALPSEAQWEYACRAGTTAAYWWGERFNEADANNGNTIRAEKNYPANPFGLKSMHGNLWEWCADWLGDYPDQPIDDPHGPAEGRRRVLRGGSWILHAQRLRAAQRHAFTPDFRSLRIGLRLAGGLDPQASASAMPADRWLRSGQQRGGQGAGNEEDRE